MAIKARYFIAIIPPSPYFEQASGLKNYFRDVYKSKAALNSPPHITLHMPFEWRSDREESLIESLEKFSSIKKTINVTFENFNCFEPRVIFIQAVFSKELNELQRALRQFCKMELGLFNADYKDLPFHPHITLAYRDLKKLEFAKAWEEFKEKKFEGSFIASHLCLLRHEEGKWIVRREFVLGIGH